MSNTAQQTPPGSPDSRPRPSIAKRKAEFTFKQQAPSEPSSEPSNPALQRYKEPTAPGTFVRALPFFKAAAVAALVLLVATIAVGFLPLKPAEVRMARLAEASGILKTLTAAPSDYQALHNLRGLGRTLRQDSTEGAVADSLMAVAALSQLNAGFIEEGLAACRYVQKEAAGSPAADVVDARHVFTACPACKGTGRPSASREAALTNSSSPDVKPVYDTAQCAQCDGKGQKLSKEQVSAQYLRSITEAQLAIRASLDRQKGIRVALRLRRLAQRFLPFSS
jgi:hypothetical protein